MFSQGVFDFVVEDHFSRFLFLLVSKQFVFSICFLNLFFGCFSLQRDRRFAGHINHVGGPMSRICDKYFDIFPATGVCVVVGNNSNFFLDNNKNMSHNYGRRGARWEELVSVEQQIMYMTGPSPTDRIPRQESTPSTNNY